VKESEIVPYKSGSETEEENDDKEGSSKTETETETEEVATNSKENLVQYKYARWSKKDERYQVCFDEKKKKKKRRKLMMKRKNRKRN
jgi:hypothetical protein